MSSFYEESDEYREEIALQQREKGLKKYPTPFNPDDWTDDELADHAMAEFHDGQEYVAGMRRRMRQLQAMINYQDARLKQAHIKIAELEKQIERTKLEEMKNARRPNTTI